MGGTGKTELAKKFIEEIAAQFPDAQIIVDMNGTKARHTTPAEAMGAVIQAWDRSLKLPESEAEVRALYHSTLAGKRALIFLDDAFDQAQVEKLAVPRGSLLLITSRERIILADAHRLDLDQHPFSEADSIKLLRRIEPRIGADAPRLAQLCGHLPFALRQAAAALAQHQALAVADYLPRLEKNRLASLPEVAATLRLSYDLLPPERQTRFRALGVFPGGFDKLAASIILDTDEPAAAETIEALETASLISWDRVAERCHLHDLVRDFALSLLSVQEKEILLLRHAGFYKNVLAVADEFYMEGGKGIARGLALFDRERRNIEAGHAWVEKNADANKDAARLAAAYPDAGAYVLELRHHARERIRWLTTAVTACQKLADREGEGNALGNLGNAYAALGDARSAIRFGEQQLAIARKRGDRRTEGTALGNLGIAYRQVGDVRKSIATYEQQLVIARELADWRSVAGGLGSLGNAHFTLKEPRLAIEFYEQQLVIAREHGDRHIEDIALGNLGSAHGALGETRKAIGLYEQALAIDRELGDRIGEGADLGNLGSAYLTLGDPRKCIEMCEQAMLVHREVGDRRGESKGLWNSALAYDTLGDRAEAIARAEASLKLCEEIDDPMAAKVRAILVEWRKK